QFALYLIPRKLVRDRLAWLPHGSDTMGKTQFVSSLLSESTACPGWRPASIAYGYGRLAITIREIPCEWRVGNRGALLLTWSGILFSYGRLPKDGWIGAVAA